MKTILSILAFLVFSGNVLFGQITISLVPANVTCFGLCNGVVNPMVTGGTAPYTYLWSTGATTQVVTGLCPGTYTVTVTDATLLTATQTVTITQPPALTLTSTQTNVVCHGYNDGAATITINGGTPPYTYQWPLAAGNQTTPTAINLAAGCYVITVTDANACTQTITICITEAPELIVSITSLTNVSCNGLSDGSLTASATGGTPAYTYIWNNAATTPSIFGLGIGTYTVTVNDALGCMSVATATITQPAAVTSTFTASSIDCFGDNSIVTYTGNANISPLFNWNFNGGTIVSGSGIGPYTINFSTAGNHSISLVVLENGCTSATTTQNISNPPALILTSTQTNIICSGTTGAATIIINGGNPPYTYQWPPSAGNQTTPTAINLVAGCYVVTVTDANMCTATTTVCITEAPLLTVSITAQTNVTCNGDFTGSLTATPTGGTPGYTYVWTNLTNTPTITGLNAGTYSVTVVDVNGCTATTTSATITEPTAITVTANITDATCLNNDGQIVLTISGGIPMYQYLWVPPTVGVGNTATNLSAGTYTSIITDVNGCTKLNNWIVNQSSTLAILSGTASYSGGDLPAGDGIVNLFMESGGGGSGQFDSLTSQVLTSTGFQFTGLMPGKYFIKVDLTNPTLYPTLLNTYFDNTFLWTNADTIILACDDNINIPVQMYETFFAPTGNCDISGSIMLMDAGGGKSIKFTNDTKASSEPVPGAEIIIEQEPNDTPVQIAFTDQNGDYTLTNIPVGSGYHLLVDIPGYPMLSTFIDIVVGPTDTQLSNFNFLLDTASGGGILIDNQTGISNPFIESGFQFITVYPNPVSEFMYVNFELTKDNSISIDLITETGAIVKQLLNIPDCKKGIYHYQLDIPSTLSSGNYFIRLRDDRNTLVKKVILK